MIERRSFKLFAPVAYLCLSGLIGVSAAGIGLSEHFAARALSTGSRDDASAAVAYSPYDPKGYIASAVLHERGGDHVRAADDYRRAAELQRNDYVIWMQLGDALSKAASFDAAADAYKTASSSAPNYSEPHRRLGRMLIEQGRLDEGFSSFRRAAVRNSILYTELLELAREHFPASPAAIEDAAGPVTLSSRKTMTRFLIDHDLITDAAVAFLTGSDLSNEEKDEFIGQLNDKKNRRLAYEVWTTKSNISPFRPTEKEPVYDGGFEKIRETDKSGFGWQVARAIPGVAIAIDDQLFLSGSRSLNIRFAGAVETGERLLSQTIFLRPNSLYRLGFAVLSRRLTSASLPIMVVTVSGRDSSPASTKGITATGGIWVNHTLEFRTSDGGTAVISLQREACNAGPCPIFGELSLDDIAVNDADPAH